MSHERVVPSSITDQRQENIVKYPTNTPDTAQDATLKSMLEFRTHLIDLKGEGIMTGTLFVFNEDSIRSQLSNLPAPKTQSAIRS